MPYPHEALVRAWLAGRDVQYLDVATDCWVSLPRPEDADKMPHFYPRREYRLKPELMRYRVGVHRLPGGSISIVLAQDLREEELLSRRNGFIRWITEWTEFNLEDSSCTTPTSAL